MLFPRDCGSEILAFRDEAHPNKGMYLGKLSLVVLIFL